MCKFCGYAFWNLKVYQRKNALGSSISYYYAWIFTRKEIKFFQFCGFLNILKSFGRVLQSVSAYWLFSAHIYRRLPTHLDWIFTKKLVCTPPNTVAARIFGRVELTLENAVRVYLDYNQKCKGLVSLSYEHPSNNYCSNPHKSGNRLSWISILSMTVCHYVTMPMLEFTIVLATLILTIVVFP